MIVPSPNIQDNLKSFFLDGTGSYRKDDKLKVPTAFAETSDFPGIPIVSMVCLNQKLQITGLCVRQEMVHSAGAPHRSEVVNVEVFWK